MGWENPNQALKVSEYNAAAFKMKRLHDILERINNLNMDLLGHDLETGEEHYKIKLNCCNNLYMEVRSYLKQPDKEYGDELSKQLAKLINKCPVRKPIMRWGKPTNKVTFDYETWEYIQNGLDVFEKLVRTLIVKTKMDTKEAEDDSGL